jgi:acetyl-CoA synthetase
VSRTSAPSNDRISSVLTEKRQFAPPADFAGHAHVPSAAALSRLRRQAAADVVAFWQERARELVWFRDWKRPLDWKHPHARWFVGGAINASVNCLDRHLGGWRRTKAALIWEGEPGEVRTLTYQQLHAEVCKAANAMLHLGVKQGDVVGIYMGMVPEAVIAMLACSRIGATHNVIFGGFSSEAVRERINDSGAVLLITQDGAFRRGSSVPLKSAADVAVKKCPTIRNLLVVRRTGEPVTMKRGRDHWWHDVVAGASAINEPAQLDSEHPLFILYTSGSTGKP